MQAALPELEELAGLPTRAIPDGQLLFDPSRACLGFPLVDKGSIKVFKAFPNGREILLYHVTPGQTCVVSAACLFSGLPYGASAVTQGPVELRLIPPPAFDRLMSDAAFRRFVMAQFTQRLSDLMTLLDAVFLISRMPQADCIVKSEAWRNPFLRHVVRWNNEIR